MHKTNVIIIIGIGILLLAIVGFFVSKKLFFSEKIHYHAGFVVFQDNKKLDFSDIKFMYTKPCVVKGAKDTVYEDTQLEKAHLHDRVGDLIHIEGSGATWQDLFKNIRYPIEYSKTTAYINNKKVTNFQKLPIQPYDSLVVFIGENNQELLKEGVTKEYMESQSSKSTTCGE